MAAANLLTLIDDIATLLDDVAVLSKVAAKKTAGVLGDDLAVNADQVSGVKPDRELAVVWAVAKGSLLNKVILIPAALAISALLPILITLLLIAGGIYLCFEGAEKVAHWLSGHKTAHSEAETAQRLSNDSIDLVALEKSKIRGAIRTDFILSAEIVVIALGTMQDQPLGTQFFALSALALAITVGVYGLVAMIVKLDDAGLYLLRKSVSGSWNTLQRTLGRGLLRLAPMLMRTLTIVGTIAMFLVGGGILTHNVGAIHHIAEAAIQLVPAMSLAVSLLFDAAIGLCAGFLVVAALALFTKLRR